MATVMTILISKRRSARKSTPKPALSSISYAMAPANQTLSQPLTLSQTSQAQSTFVPQMPVSPQQNPFSFAALQVMADSNVPFPVNATIQPLPVNSIVQSPIVTSYSSYQPQSPSNEQFTSNAFFSLRDF